MSEKQLALPPAEAGGEISTEANGRAQVPSLIPRDPFQGRRQVATFLNTSSQDRRDQLARALALDDPNFPASGLVCIDCIGLTMYTRRVTPVGEEPIQYGVYLALHGKDGRNYVTAGSGAMDAAADLAGVYGKPPWKDGVRVTIGRAQPKLGRIARVIVAAGDLTRGE